MHRTFNQVVKGEALLPKTVRSNVIPSDHQVPSIKNQLELNARSGSGKEVRTTLSTENENVPGTMVFTRTDNS